MNTTFVVPFEFFGFVFPVYRLIHINSFLQNGAVDRQLHRERQGMNLSNFKINYYSLAYVRFVGHS